MEVSEISLVKFLLFRALDIRTTISQQSKFQVSSAFYIKVLTIIILNLKKSRLKNQKSEKNELAKFNKTLRNTEIF